MSRNELLTQLHDYPVVRTKNNIEYLNIPAAFDIETSSFYLNEEKNACMYIWQLGIDNLVTTGRTWDEFSETILALQQFLELNDHRRLIIYVHNLAYEFQWMRKRFEWDNVFMLDNRKPVYALTNGIEFRCSLKLSGGRSLEAVGDELRKYPVKKLVGNLDYDKVRSSSTKLTDEEMAYCENDIRVLLHYIQEKIENEGGIDKIPLTNTGYVRNYCRKECKRDFQHYRALMNNLTVEPDEYRQLKRAFAGGFTHANAKYVDKELEHVGSFDLRSSYPAVMVLMRFPMSRSKLITEQLSKEEFEQYLQRYCCMFDLELWDVEPQLFQDNPISASKCGELTERNHIENNGRVVYAKHLKITCTELDYEIYRRFYKWRKQEVANLRVYNKGYLPKPIVMSILKFYHDKTALKGVEGKELDYMISKNMINASYGMMVTAIVRKNITYGADDEYHVQLPDIDDALHRYNTGYNRFLFYPWGVWVTAYARANLFMAIMECGNDYVYSDTDSVKILNPERHYQFFDRYKARIADLISKSAEHFKISPDEYSPLTPKGVVSTIGEWDNEGIYDKFKTLGAKRYLVVKGGKLQLTVAGVNKKSACKYLENTGKPFSNFNTELIVPEDYTRRKLLTYIDEPTRGRAVDYLGAPFEFSELSSVHMEATDYTFDRSETFAKYLKGEWEIDE